MQNRTDVKLKSLRCLANLSLQLAEMTKVIGNLMGTDFLQLVMDDLERNYVQHKQWATEWLESS